MNGQQKRQPLKFPPRAESLARLRALYNRIAIAPTSAATQELAASKIGDVMKDGSIFAGISPDTGKQMFAMPTDLGLTITFSEAAQYAKKLNSDKALGHDDWRVPTRAELNVLFLNREEGALEGTFNVTGSIAAVCYWSSKLSSGGSVWIQRFSDGLKDYFFKTNAATVRCVR